MIAQSAMDSSSSHLISPFRSSYPEDLRVPIVGGEIKLLMTTVLTAVPSLNERLHPLNECKIAVRRKTLAPPSMHGKAVASLMGQGKTPQTALFELSMPVACAGRKMRNLQSTTRASTSQCEKYSNT
jgi:hypothetical protein